MTIPFEVDTNFLNTHTESMLGDLSMNGAFARSDPSPALRDQTYVTVEDNTAVLPNSMPLSGLSSGFLSNTTLTGILNPRTFVGTANQVTVTNGDGVGGNPTLSLPSDLRLPGTLLAGGDVNLNGHNIVTTDNSSINIVTTGFGKLHLNNFVVTVQNKIATYNSEDNYIYFGPNYLWFNVGDSITALKLNQSNAILGVPLDVAGYDIVDSANDIVTVDADIFKVRNEIASISGGVIDFSSPVQFSAATHQIRVPVGTNLQIYASSSLDWIELLANTVNIKESVIFNSTPTNNMTYVNGAGEHELWFNLNNTTSMILSPAGATIPGITVVNEIAKYSQTSNNILFGNNAQTYNISGASVFDINASGFRLGSGYRVNNITNSPSSVLDTDIPTMFAVQTAIGNAVMGANPFRGFWDASGGTYPTTGGTGSGGDIEAGNWWRISVAGTLGGDPVDIGDQIFAGVDNPGQTPANWTVVNPRVNSVFNRTGAVVAEDDDYPFNYITGLPDTASSGKLMRGNGSAWVESTSTFADTYAQYDILYASSANTVTGLAKQSNSVLTSNIGSVPAWLTLGNFQFLGGSLTGPKPFIITVGNGLTGTNNSGTTPGTVNLELSAPVSIENGGTNTTAAIGANGTLAQSDGSKYTFTTATYPSTAGTSGTLLTSNGTNIVNTTATYPSTAGTSGTILRSNGTNIVNSTPTFPNTATSGKVMRGDGTNWVESTPTYPNTANTGKVLRGDGTNWVETTAQYPDTAGTSGNILKSDGTNWVSSPISASCAHAALSNNPLPTKALNTTPAEISGASVAWTLDYATDFSMANDGQLKYTGASTKTFLVCASFAVGNVTQGLVALKKNGSTTIKQIIWYNSQMFPAIMNYKVTLAQNDYLSIYFNFTTGSGATLNVCATMSAFEWPLQ